MPPEAAAPPLLPLLPPIKARLTISGTFRPPAVCRHSRSRWLTGFPPEAAGDPGAALALAPPLTGDLKTSPDPRRPVIHKIELVIVYPRFI